MGQAIAEKINVNYRVLVFDKDQAKIKDLIGINRAVDLSQLLKSSQAVILAIKPQDFDSVLAQIRDNLRGKLVISIAAGMTTEFMQKILGEVKVVRVMPNLAVRIAASTTAICKGAFASQGDLKFTAKLFACLGKVFVLPEWQMDAVTAISGSGPAYIFYDMEINHRDPVKITKELQEEYTRKLCESARAVGFDPKLAQELARSTAGSSIRLAAQRIQTPAQLRKLVTSPGGTTEAALQVISAGGSWPQAALAAKKRAQDLTKK